MAIARKFGDKVYKWDVPALQAAAADLPVHEVPVERFDLNVDAWFGEACSPTIAHVVHHMRYVLAADLNNPILLSAEGHVFDGLHRLAKCALEGVSMVKCRQFKENPPPFEMVPFDAFREARPRIAETLVWMEQHVL